MAIMRTRSRIANPAPPPSPIPTAKGSRSASNEILAQFLDKTVRIPDLTLPASRSPAPADVDLRSLASFGSINRLLGSAKEFGAFFVRGHGVSADELRSLVREADYWVFGNSEIPRGFVRLNGDREEMVWIRNGNQSLQQVIGVEKYRDFSGKMDNIANKLDAIAEQLSQVFFTNEEKQQSQNIILQGKEIALSLYRYNHQNSMEQNRALHEELKGEMFDHALSLHLPIEPCEFHVQSEAGPFSFDAGTEAIIVTVGKQIEEWSNKEFKSVSGEMIFSPHINGSQPSFSIELRFSTSSFKNVLGRNFKTISIIDQIVIAIVFALLYKYFVFISSLITGT